MDSWHLWATNCTPLTPTTCTSLFQLQVHTIKLHTITTRVLYLDFLDSLSSALRTAECIVMVLGHVASHMGSKFNVVATVTTMFGQRLFHPTSPLDGKLVGELARIAAHTAVWGHGGMGTWEN